MIYWEVVQLPVQQDVTNPQGSAPYRSEEKDLA